MAQSLRILDATSLANNLAIFGEAFAGKRAAPLTTRSGVELDAAVLFSDAEDRLIGKSKPAQAIIEAILDENAKILLQQTRRVVKARGAVKSGTFLSAFAISKLRDRVYKWRSVRTLVNPTPYASFVHPKGTPKSQTIVNVDIGQNLLPEIRMRLASQILAARPQIARLLALAVVAK